MTISCVEFCRALADDTRQRILQLLMDVDELSVSQIVAAFHVSQPTISHHLALLRQIDLVTSRKDGKQVYYALNRERVVACCGRLMARFDPSAPRLPPEGDLLGEDTQRSHRQRRRAPDVRRNRPARERG